MWPVPVRLDYFILSSDLLSWNDIEGLEVFREIQYGRKVVQL